MKTLTALALVLIVALAALPVAAQQGGKTHYVYDANGRLRAVIAPSGEAAIYDYDPAGNFTAIRRLGVNDCEALSFAPGQGPLGTKVTIYGVGFKGQVTAVSFNGVKATITKQTPISVEAEVPDGATTGPISVTLPCGGGERRLAGQFIVSGVRVRPQAITLLPGRMARFFADVMGVIDPSVEWSVNDVKGGNDTFGKIDDFGFYAAPSTPPSNQPVVIRATSIEDRTLFGEARIVITAQASEFLASGVSVRFGQPPNPITTYAVRPVSVRLGTSPNEITAQVTRPISVRFGESPREASAQAYQSVSVRVGNTPNNVSSSPLNSVSVRLGATVTSVTTSKPLTRGGAVTLTIEGQNLGGVKTIEFIDEDGAADAHVAVSEIKVTSSSTTLTAKVAANNAAKPGRRIIRIVTDAGASMPLAAGGHSVEVFIESEKEKEN